MSNKLRVKDREECMAGARLIYLAMHRKEAIRKLFPKKVVDKAKEVAHEKDSK